MRKVKRNMRVQLIVLGLFLLLILLFWVDLNTGFTKITFQEIGDIFRGEASRSVKAKWELSILEFRVPRIIMALLVGLGLSVSGCLLQGVAQNELADPGVIGINAGAGLMVALMITVFSQSMTNISFAIFAAAFVGSLVTAGVVYILSFERKRSTSPNRLILTGIAISSAITAITTMVLLRMREEEYGFVAGWLSGNIWGANWGNIRLVVPWIVVFLVLAYYKSNTLNVISMGAQISTGLGVKQKRDNLLLLAIAVGLSSVCVAVGGGISFVGLVCPHMARKMVGSRHQVLIPVSALLGGILLLLSDIIGRTIISPGEISIGVVATVIGTPYFLYLLVNKRR